MSDLEEEQAFEQLVTLAEGRRMVALTGAGCSTESGIPDYRGPETLRKARNPIPYSAFVSDPAAQTRYWARSAVGWQRFSRFRPNAGHVALARLEASGHLAGIITQNVDRLHQAAGSRRVVELHGALAEVHCLSCSTPESRFALQERIAAMNPGWLDRTAEIAPDGDAELPDETIRTFRAPACTRCGGVLKPAIVFFGENVPRSRVDEALSLLDEAGLLLVAGSSLAVYSGLRFVRRAVEKDIPVAIVNLGPTRGDHLARIHLNARTGTVLSLLVERLEAETQRR